VQHASLELVLAPQVRDSDLVDQVAEQNNNLPRDEILSAVRNTAGQAVTFQEKQHSMSPGETTSCDTALTMIFFVYSIFLGRRIRHWI
jgi:hypothetical protein